MGLPSMTENDSYDTFRFKKRQFDYATSLQKRTENGAQYIKTLTILCTIEVEWCKRRGFSQRYIDHR